MIRLGMCPDHGPWTRGDAGDDMTCPGSVIRKGDAFVRVSCGLADVTAECDRKNDEAEKAATVDAMRKGG